MAGERTCIGCRRRAEPGELLRLVVQDETLLLGRDLPGRGAWLCADVVCFDQAARRNAFGRALRATVTTPMIESLRMAFVDQADHARG